MMHQFLVILLALPAVLCIDCANRADGDYEISCRAYTTCLNGVSSRTSCPMNTVYNSKTRSCDDIKNVSPPCGQLVNCVGKADGHYVDSGCHSYYTCAGSAFFGHNICPIGTVFDNTKQGCNWPQFVDPPCGTKGKSTPKPLIPH